MITFILVYQVLSIQNSTQKEKLLLKCNFAQNSSDYEGLTPLWRHTHVYCRPYTYCRRKQFMPVLAAHIIALKHIHVLSPATVCQYRPFFFSGQNEDNICGTETLTDCHQQQNNASELKQTIAKNLKNAIILKYLYILLKIIKSQLSALHS